MSPQEYITQKIDALVQEFPGIIFNYQFDELSDTHFIEVLPKSFFEKYEHDFIIKQNQIVLEFINLFPEEGVAFITEGDLFKVNKPIYTNCHIQTPTDNSLDWYHNKVNALFATHTPDLKSSFVLDQDIHGINNCLTSFQISYQSDSQSIASQNMDYSSTKSKQRDDEKDSNYSLAA